MKPKLITSFLFCMFLINGIINAQSLNIRGKVTDPDGVPLIGVSILIKGSGTGFVSDLDGNFAVQANVGQVLIFTYTGQKTQEIRLLNSAPLNIQMEEETAILGEIVVIAYGEQSRKKLVQSVSTISNDNIRDIPANSPQELLQGQASGVQVVNSSGILGAAPGN